MRRLSDSRTTSGARWIASIGYSVVRNAISHERHLADRSIAATRVALVALFFPRPRAPSYMRLREWSDADAAHHSPAPRAPPSRSHLF